MSILLKLAILLGAVVLLVAGILLWQMRQYQEWERRRRGPDRMLRSERPSKETGHWNLS